MKIFRTRICSEEGKCLNPINSVRSDLTVISKELITSLALLEKFLPDPTTNFSKFLHLLPESLSR